MENIEQEISSVELERENVSETTEYVPDPEKSTRFQNESKERMSKICQQIGLLEKIANKRNVDYTKENVEKMFAYLESQLASCKKTFMAHFDENEVKTFDFDF